MNLIILETKRASALQQGQQLEVETDQHRTVATGCAAEQWKAKH